MRGRYQFWLNLILILSLIISTALVSPVIANSTRIYVDPPSIIDETRVIGTSFTININVAAVIDLFGFEFKLKYKTAVLTATKITLGPFFPPPGPPPYGSVIFKEEINDTIGYVWYSAVAPAIPGIGVSGSGTLATVSFTVDDLGGSCLYLSDTSNHRGLYVSDTMLSDSEGNPIIHEVYDGHFVNDPVHDIAITSVTPFATEVIEGQSVDVNVLARNHGNFTESFTVTVYANSTIIGPPRTVTDLIPGDRKTLTFTWDTTGVAPSKYIISANTTAVSGETDTTDNSYNMAFDYHKRTYVYVTVTIIKHPVAVFSYSPTKPAIGETVTFNASDSIPNGGTIDWYRWDFGDGESVRLVLPVTTHVYESPGTYRVTLAIKDSEGLTDTTWKLIAPTPPVITATLNIEPDTLNLKSEGKWITAYIQFTEEHNAEDIDASTILLNETIQPVLDPKYDFVTNSSEYIVDHDSDGVLERMVKFNRTEVASWISDELGIQYGDITLTIIGGLFDGTPFEGSDTIRVNYAGDVNKDGVVNGADFYRMGKAYASTPHSPNWDPDCDINRDLIVNGPDFSAAGKNYGATVP